MSTRDRFRKDKEVSQADLNSQGSQNKHIKLAASTADFYTEWTTEKTPIENPKSGNSAEHPNSKANLRQSIKSKYKRMSGNMDTYIPTCLNEIYNRPDLFIFH